MQHNDGPWHEPDDFRKVNALVRFSQGDALNGFSITGMGYRGRWDSTDQVPARAIDDGRIDRFGTIDSTDGGDSYRYAGSVEWQRTRNNASTKVSAFGLAYDLNLFSNFTYFLDDPDNGDQFRQADHRFVSGAKVTHRRLGQWGSRPVQNVVGVQVRRDDIGNVGLYHTVARQPLETVREDSVRQTSVGGFAQNETQWTPWLRTLAGVRVDGYRFDVDAGEPANSGTDGAGLVSPKGGAVFGPWRGTELYVNGGFGFHSNDARGATITIDPATGAPAQRVTPLARARGAEVGVRSVRIPHLQTSLAVWTLNLDSELIFIGDAGNTEAGRPSHRYGVEFANYYSPRPWLTLDVDLSLSRARFTDADPAGNVIPGAVSTVVQAGVTVDSVKNVFGSVRWRYFGPRALIEDDSVRSQATSLVNLEAGYRFTRSLRLAVDVFNLLDARHSDVDYFYASRLPGEPAEGIEDLHLHPTLPRTARVSLQRRLLRRRRSATPYCARLEAIRADLSERLKPIYHPVFLEVECSTVDVVLVHPCWLGWWRCGSRRRRWRPRRSRAARWSATSSTRPARRCRARRSPRPRPRRACRARRPRTPTGATWWPACRRAATRSASS